MTQEYAHPAASTPLQSWGEGLEGPMTRLRSACCLKWQQKVNGQKWKHITISASKKPTDAELEHFGPQNIGGSLFSRKPPPFRPKKRTSQVTEISLKRSLRGALVALDMEVQDLALKTWCCSIGAVKPVGPLNHLKNGPTKNQQGVDSQVMVCST